MNFDEYRQRDAVALAEGVRRGDFSAAELLQTALQRLEAVNPRLNAVVRRRDERALAEASAVDTQAVLAGVPFLAKDLLDTLAGEPTGSGTRLLQSLPMPADSELARRWRRAGLVLAGRTNTPEFGIAPVTEPAVHGPTLNPWNLERSPGGSSGGSAAAVAAGIVPMASAGDGGGSIRIPASCCGLFGFKPSRGLLPTGPLAAEIWRGFVTGHVVSRSVRDSAVMLDATGGADPGAPYAAPMPSRPFSEAAGADPRPLRIAFSARPLFGSAPVHADCVEAMHDAARLLVSLGHHVEEAAPPVEAEACAQAFITIVAAETRASLEWAASLHGRAPRAADFEGPTYTLGLLGRALSASDYAQAATLLQMQARRLAPFFARHDLLLTPTLAAPPLPIGALQPTAAEKPLMALVNALGAGGLLKALGVVDQVAARTFAFMPFTPLFNVTGQPAMSVPLHWNAQGLPVGVQLVGRLGEDALLMSLAGQLERARPWFGRVPDL